MTGATPTLRSPHFSSSFYREAIQACNLTTPAFTYGDVDFARFSSEYRFTPSAYLNKVVAPLSVFISLISAFANTLFLAYRFLTRSPHVALQCYRIVRDLEAALGHLVRIF